jgi:hypothetical protein
VNGPERPIFIGSCAQARPEPVPPHHAAASSKTANNRNGTILSPALLPLSPDAFVLAPAEVTL